jgi:hypothetical protein
MQQYRTFGINELEEMERGPIWVLNTSKQKFNMMADVFISIPGENGSTATSAMVPATWLPINLTDRFSRRALLRSTNFAEALQNGLMSVIGDEDARKILAGRDVASERARLAAREQAIETATRVKGLGKNVTIVNPNDDTAEEQPNPQPVIVQSNSPVRTIALTEDDQDVEDGFASEELSPQFQSLVLNLNTLDEATAVNRIKQAADVSLAEATYLRDNTVHGRLKKMAERTIAALQD